MVGDFSGVRFQVGSVTIEQTETVDKVPLFFLYGNAPTLDRAGGSRVYITSVYQSEKKANDLRDALNQA